MRMILRFESEAAARLQPTRGAWESFVATQESHAPATAFISQPAHAALAGQLATALTPLAFGDLSPEVVKVIGLHDAGWAQPDLAAFESADPAARMSFLAFPSTPAIRAWRRSIADAEQRGTLAHLLTVRHFCLLAPEDDAHREFLQSENRHREQVEAACKIPPEDRDRFTAALGFCDLLSLLLCSGFRGHALLPFAHPADPAAAHAPQVTIDLSGELVRFDQPVIRPETSVSASLWSPEPSGGLGLCRHTWCFT